MDAIHADTHRFIATLESIATLSEEEKAALSRLPMRVTHLRADQDIVRDGDRPTRSCLIVEGYACRYRVHHA